MNYQDTSKLESIPEQRNNKDKFAIDKAKSDLKALQSRLKAEQKARLNAEKALGDAQETLSIFETELEQERLDRNKAEQSLAILHDQFKIIRAQVEEQHQTRIQPDQEKVEVEETLENAAINFPERNEPRPSFSLPESRSGEQSIFFRIRLVLDEHRQVKRTEIRHNQSNKKDVFKSFSAQRLVDFITSTLASIESAEGPDPLVQTNPISINKSEPANPEIALTIKDLQIICTDEQGDSGLIFDAYKPFFIQTYFQIDEIESFPKTSWNVPYEINVYAQRIDAQSTALIADESANLGSGIHECYSRVQISGLPAGLFRLVMFLKLRTPTIIARGVQGPFLQIRPA